MKNSNSAKRVLYQLSILLTTLCIVTLVIPSSLRIAHGDSSRDANDSSGVPSVNVMGPLLIGNPYDPSGHDSAKAWEEFYWQMKEFKAAGGIGITVDVWWGLVERNAPNDFNWEYYRRVAAILKETGLLFFPIGSIHQLGGNVGDKGYMPLPSWIWSRYRNDPQNFENENDLMFKSEQGHFNGEHISPWATRLVLEDYRRFLQSFAYHFAGYADIIPEINISLGPAGELRYPSYDKINQNADYPERGVLQCYTNAAKNSFRKYLQEKFSDIGNLNQALRTNYSSFRDIEPPNPSQDVNFWTHRKQYSEFGKVFFDWYQDSLIQAGRATLDVARSVFLAPDSPFKHVRLGAKIPGIHWRAGSDRAAELTAGQIRSSKIAYQNGGNGDPANSDEEYRPILGTFLPGDRVHYTALEMSDGNDLSTNLPASLARTVGRIGRQLGLDMRGENALPDGLGDPRTWDNMYRALTEYGFNGITLLRGNEILADSQKMNNFRGFVWRVNQIKRQNSRRGYHHEMLLGENSCSNFYR
jgi:beta-amylase